MYFQIENTPEEKRRKRKEDSAESQSNASNSRLILAPFSKAPIVTFENILVGVQSVRLLEVANPGPNILQLCVTKAPPADLGLQLSWTELTIGPNQETTLELFWCPLKPHGQRISMQFGDQRKGRYDVSVILKSYIKKQIKSKPPQKSKPAGQTRTLLGVKKSPKFSVMKRASPKQYKELKKIANLFDIDDQSNNDFSIKYKKSQFNNIYPSNCNVTEWMEDLEETNLRRETYMIRSNKVLENENDSIIFCSPISQKSQFIHENNHKQSKAEKNITNVNHGKENNDREQQNNSLKDNLDFSFGDNLKFTPLRCCTNTESKVRSVRNEEVKSTVVKSLYHITTIDVENTTVTIKNRQNVSDDFDLDNHTFNVPKNKNIPFAKNVNVGNQENQNPNINTTHTIIDLLDASTNSRIDMSHSIQYIPNRSTHINVFRERQNEQPSSLPTYVCSNLNNTESSPQQRVSYFTPNNKNLSAQNDSMFEFNPKRCSTERKECNHLSCIENSQEVCRDLFQVISPVNVTYDSHNTTYGKISSDTYCKVDSPIIPIDPANHECLQSSPYSVDLSPLNPIKSKHLEVPDCHRKLPFNENLKNYNERIDLRNAIKEKNSTSGVQSIIEANMWQRSPPRPPSPTPLASIPEESTINFENSIQDSSRRVNHDTFVLDRTYDKMNRTQESIKGDRDKWTKTINPQDIRPVRNSVAHKYRVGEESIISNGSHIVTEHMIDDSSHYLNIQSIATTIDPFMASTCLYDQQAYDEMEKEFKMWLNYLLTPPADLDTNLDGTKIDIGKVWIDNRNKSVPAAPTREQVSSQYHTSHRLDSLRKSAKVFIENPNMCQVFLKVANQVERKILTIRNDKDLHLDIGLQKIILSLLLCYNPLWLRIGLETLYGKKIPLSSNNDFMGLSEFIIECMFRDPYIGSKHSNPAVPNVHIPSYSQNIKKFTLKKFLFLVYFLDRAKLVKLIPHDPCLFCRNAPYKESREILIQFTKEVLSGVGDITRHLKPTGYMVSHKQTYLNEFKYAVHNLAVDLKDGVRLTRLMEIILLKENLISGLRTPAISRLQKVHNVKIALTALESAGFNIVGDISPKDIADGHREKTLSLLWQIINKFRLPLFDNAALVIQKWWRRKYLKIWVTNRIEQKKLMILNRSATVIQSWWRKITCRRQYLKKLQTETAASVVIQKYWKMSICRNIFKRYVTSIIIIQRWYRNVLPLYRARKILAENQMSLAAVKIQWWYRRMKRTQCEVFKQEREHFLALKNSAIRIQTAFRANLEMKKTRKVYITIKTSTLKIQRYYRAILSRRIVQKQYMQLKYSIILIQRRFRANILMNECQTKYVEQKCAASKIQQFYRSYHLMKEARDNYLEIKSAVLKVQAKYRAKLAMIQERQHYAQLKSSAIIIQKHYRGYRLMKSISDSYLKKKHSAIVIQQYYRAYLAMKSERKNYLNLRSACLTIQKRYRANKLMIKMKEDYNILRCAAICMQSRYRARIAMRNVRKEYVEYRSAVVLIQRFFRGKRETVVCKNNYEITRTKIIKIQHWYRSIAHTRKVRSEYLSLKMHTINIQQRFRANTMAKASQKDYESLRNACTVIQRRHRANALMRHSLEKYTQIKLAAITIQTRYRAYLMMKEERKKYVHLKETAIKIQKYYRNLQFTKEVKNQYNTLKTITVYIQQTYRAKLAMKKMRQEYLMQRQSAIVIQQFYRGYCKMISARKSYLQQVHSAIVIQRLHRATLNMRSQRMKYLELKCACVSIQRRYRANKLMTEARNDLQTLRCAVITIQKRYRALLVMRTVRWDYIEYYNTILYIQRTFRGRMVMLHYRNDFVTKRTAIVKIQQWYRSVVHARKVRCEYLTLKTNTVNIQRRFRANLIAKACLEDYEKLKNACLVIQRRYRSKILMRDALRRYETIKAAVVIIQVNYRAYLAMKAERQRYLHLRETACKLQTIYRNHKLTKETKCNYLKLRMVTIDIQRRYRALLAMRQTRQQYLSQIKSVNIIQRYYRSYCNRVILYQQVYRERLSAAIKIQSFCRMCVIRMKYLSLKNAAITTQIHFRNLMLTKNIRSEYLIFRFSVIKIQSYVRQWIARKKYLSILNSVKLIQNAYRYKVMLRTQKLQRELRISSAIKIQAYWRAYQTRSSFLELKQSVVLCQRRRKAILEMRRYRESYIMLRKSVVTIQSSVVRWLERRSVAKRLEAKNFHKIHNAATVIQSHWRGYSLRKEQDKESKIAKLRRRWREGALESDQKTLAERNEDALIVLCHFRDVASVITAFKTLDILTSVYPKMYGSRDFAVPIIKKLVMYMGVSNRSVSTLETLQLGIAILLNLTTYQPTAQYVYSADTINTVLTLMLRWCDKDNLLSRLFCTLLWMFGKYNNIKEDLSTFLLQPDSYKIMCRVRGLLIRKRRMDGNKRTHLHPAPPSTGSHDARRSMTPVKPGRVLTASLPSTELNYDIRRYIHPRIFMDEIQAIDAVFFKFNLPLVIIPEM